MTVDGLLQAHNLQALLALSQSSNLVNEPWKILSRVSNKVIVCLTGSAQLDVRPTLRAYASHNDVRTTIVVAAFNRCAPRAWRGRVAPRLNLI
jgi:hypothetical protein